MCFSVIVHKLSPTEAYLRVDTVLRKRTIQQRVSAIVSDIAEITDLPVEYITSVIRGIRILGRQIQGIDALVPSDDKLLLKVYANEIRQLYDLLYIRNDLYGVRKVLLKTKPVAVLLHILKENKGSATEFIKIANSGSNEKTQQQPFYGMLTYFTGSGATSRHGVVILRAWINYLKGSKLSPGRSLTVGHKYSWQGLSFVVPSDSRGCK